ncbi:MAG: hypothetical protein GXX87_00760 [Euryarchaeota archaeon]|nr:hypothetical protein [Euryarchaeota archaeon]
MTSTCPHCGVAVPSDCGRCPRCFRDIDIEAQRRRGADGAEYTIVESGSRRERTRRERPEKRPLSSRAVLLLATLPALFGVLGLGQIVRDRRDAVGFYFLLIGLILFIPSVLLVTDTWAGGITTGLLRVSAFVLLMGAYLLTALVSLADLYFGSLFRSMRL